MTRIAAIALILGLAALAPRAPLAAEAGDAVFAERGPWSLDGTLEWRMTIEGPQAEGFRPVADGRVLLDQVIDPSDQQPVLQVTQKLPERDRRIGPFPISSGDPVLTFFLEQTARDMAALSGGSPHYIRNRMKDALFRGGELDRTDDAVTARFRPFADDPNAGRMNGFDTLTLTFVMADPADPIREFTARTEGGPGYLSRLVME
ncbi:hypothetical protein D3P06_05905 [Paracoccus aestuarii]|uniref:DUF3108 domain-containing protein n=1 Tax=Paracoccus aestuarii TaxID=453842 RepID=A0A418ZZ81_9RHOB|nr:hypothetical protein [Paracoccus aestuarii]RJL05755.1 hypothetical protein D3P06_05905 [Paracoccus aestuarii]WCQ99204.1 hypothetical protein JHW48_15525 [Paracoccus aestuarii]